MPKERFLVLVFADCPRLENYSLFIVGLYEWVMHIKGNGTKSIQCLSTCFFFPWYSGFWQGLNASYEVQLRNTNTAADVSSVFHAPPCDLVQLCQQEYSKYINTTRYPSLGIALYKATYYIYSELNCEEFLVRVVLPLEWDTTVSWYKKNHFALIYYRKNYFLHYKT